MPKDVNSQSTMTAKAERSVHLCGNRARGRAHRFTQTLLAGCLAAVLSACGGGSSSGESGALDAGTQRNAADVLWLDSFDRAALPLESREAMFAPKNRPDALATRFSNHLNALLADPSALTPDYGKLYG